MLFVYGNQANFTSPEAYIVVRVIDDGRNTNFPSISNNDF